MTETYTVVLLVEQALTAADAAQVRSLHEGLDSEVHYHVLLPADDAAARVEAALGAMGTDTLPAPTMPMDVEEVEAVREESERASEAALRSTIEALHDVGAVADGEIVAEDPVTALGDMVRRVDGREVIVMTRPHVVQEFFHVDWSSRARRKIGVPLLHLLEHESFDEQAGAGEGVTGL